MLGIFHPVLARDARALEVARVDLQARFVGEHFEQDARLGRVEAGGYFGHVALAVLEGVQAPVVVVARGILDLFECRVAGLADGLGLAEVHRRALHALDFARGDIEFVARCEAVGIDVHHLVEGILRRVAAQVEIGVIGHVDHGLLVGRGLKGDVERVVAFHGVGGLGLHRAGETVVAVGRGEREHHARVGAALDVVYLVDPARVAAPVQTVAVVVVAQGVLFATGGEPCPLDAVGVAAHGRTVVRRRVERVGILRDVVVAQHHVGGLAVLVGHGDRHHPAAIVGEAHFHAVAVVQCHEFGLLAVDGRIEGCRVEPGNRELCLSARSAGREHHGGRCGSKNQMVDLSHLSRFCRLLVILGVNLQLFL